MFTVVRTSTLNVLLRLANINEMSGDVCSFLTRCFFLQGWLRWRTMPCQPTSTGGRTLCQTSSMYRSSTQNRSLWRRRRRDLGPHSPMMRRSHVSTNCHYVMWYISVFSVPTNICTHLGTLETHLCGVERPLIKTDVFVSVPYQLQTELCWDEPGHTGVEISHRWHALLHWCHRPSCVMAEEIR